VYIWLFVLFFRAIAAKYSKETAKKFVPLVVHLMANMFSSNGDFHK
jgi:hypothetical protein